MSIYIGNTNFSKIYQGNTQIQKIYKGSQLYYSSFSYDSDAIALFARMTVQPSTALKTLINNAIIDLKVAGVWSKLDAIYFRNVHDQQAALLNWIKDAHNSTLANSPVWSPYQGFFCANGKYVNTNIDPIVTVKLKGGDYSTVWLNAITPSAASYAILGRTAAPSFYWYNYTTSMRAYYLNSSAYMGWGAMKANTMYGSSFVIYQANEYNYQYLNGVYIGNRWMPQSAFMSYSLLENYSGGGTISFSAYGASLSADNQLALYNIFQAFKTGISNLLTFGNELVTNGGFEVDTNWLKSADNSWSISDGKAHYNHVTSGSHLTNNVANYLLIGHKYKITFTISNATLNAGLLFLNHVSTEMASEFGTAGRFYSNGTYEHYFTATATTRLRIMGFISAGTTSAFDIDDISIKEIL